MAVAPNPYDVPGSPDSMSNLNTEIRQILPILIIFYCFQVPTSPSLRPAVLARYRRAARIAVRPPCTTTTHPVRFWSTSNRSIWSPGGGGEYSTILPKTCESLSR